MPGPLCIAAYAFLVAERARSSPLRTNTVSSAETPVPAGPTRRSPAERTGASRRELNLHRPPNP